MRHVREAAKVVSAFVSPLRTEFKAVVPKTKVFELVYMYYVLLSYRGILMNSYLANSIIFPCILMQIKRICL